jgi:hypothetical protein
MAKFKTRTPISDLTPDLSAPHGVKMRRERIQRIGRL